MAIGIRHSCTISRRLSLLCQDVWSTFRWKSFTNDLRLPPSLKSLLLACTSRWLTLDLVAFQSLPRTLTSLHIPHIDASQALHLPPLLRQLRAILFPITPEHLERLPNTLHTLQLSQDCFTNSNHSEDEARAIFLSRTNGKTFKWPEHLVTLDIDQCASIGDEILHELPRTLMCLSLERARYVTNSGVAALRKCDSLTTLDLSGSPLLTSDCFKHLPNSLGFLEFSGTSDIVDLHIKELPKSLRYIYMTGATKLTPACLASFPPRTSTLRLDRNANIHETDLANLSSLLRYGQSSTTCTSTFRLGAGVIRAQRGTSS